MSRFAMVIDTRKCVGCMDCVIACQTENDVPNGYCRDWIATDVRGQFPHLTMEIRSERCNHCDNAPCVACCPTGASHVAEPGHVVLVTPDKSSVALTATLNGVAGLSRSSVVCALNPVSTGPVTSSGRLGPAWARCRAARRCT
ncbi:MAG TPA: hypothetical protein PL196_05435 [Burkholderiaceae bacterium]|nr:hypothetical protein [Burkholderiaceae bacterium]